MSVEDTLLMDLDDVEAAVTERTQAIIPVHLYGQPVDMDRLMSFAQPRGIKVVEDACQAHGARCGKFRVGGIGDVGCFSFYPSKNLGALGRWWDRHHRRRRDRRAGPTAAQPREEGSSRLHVESGYCSRLHTLQAAFLDEKLPYLDEWNALRMRAAALYDDMLGTRGRRHSRSARWLHARLPPVRGQGLGPRPGPCRSLASEVSRPASTTRFRSTSSLHSPSFGYSAGDFPVAERAAASILSLPMYPYIEFDEVARVCEAVEEVTHA